MIVVNLCSFNTLLLSMLLIKVDWQNRVLKIRNTSQMCQVTVSEMYYLKNSRVSLSLCSICLFDHIRQIGLKSSSDKTCCV